MKQIQLWLGHSTFSTTADIYAHLDYSAQQETGSAIRQDGAIYVPGFGWIPDSGEENVCIIAPHAGTGEIVGEM